MTGKFLNELNDGVAR